MMSGTKKGAAGKSPAPAPLLGTDPFRLRRPACKKRMTDPLPGHDALKADRPNFS